MNCSEALPGMILLAKESFDQAGLTVERQSTTLPIKAGMEIAVVYNIQPAGKMLEVIIDKKQCYIEAQEGDDVWAKLTPKHQTAAFR